MVNLADYFAKNRHVAKYEFGQRVFGYWNNIPFIGSVGNDTVVNDLVGPQYSIHLDLPIKYKNVVYRVIIDKQSNFKKITKLVEIKDSNDKITNSKTRR